MARRMLDWSLSLPALVTLVPMQFMPSKYDCPVVLSTSVSTTSTPKAVPERSYFMDLYLTPPWITWLGRPLKVRSSEMKAPFWPRFCASGDPPTKSTSWELLSNCCMPVDTLYLINGLLEAECGFQTASS